MASLPSLYPLQFIPILKEKVWGGNKLTEDYKKNGTQSTGESWEISGVPNHFSVVQKGILLGETLPQLITKYKDQLVGKKVYQKYGNTFPLLFKFIDATQDLSVQVHPDNVLAKKRHDSFGKTEMWYILDAQQNARLILGFEESITMEQYTTSLSNNSIVTILKQQPVKKGDVFFIAPGTVHAIGAGIVLAEIQQTSDITYRIYDWDRPDIDGKFRELHTQQAIAAINYNKTQAKVTYHNLTNKTIPLCSVPYFETNKLQLTKTFSKSLSNLDSFVVYMCVEGTTNIKTPLGDASLKMGETILLPALCDQITFTTKNCTLLEVYIP